jgi:hypothetical protein
MMIKIELFKLKIKIHSCLIQIANWNVIWCLIIQMNPKDCLLSFDNLFFKILRLIYSLLKNKIYFKTDVLLF